MSYSGKEELNEKFHQSVPDISYTFGFLPSNVIVVTFKIPTNACFAGTRLFNWRLVGQNQPTCTTLHNFVTICRNAAYTVYGRVFLFPVYRYGGVRTPSKGSVKSKV